jgi:hypothetical protein
MIGVACSYVQNFNEHHDFLEEALKLALIVHLYDFLEDSVLEDADVSLFDLLAKTSQS